MPPRVRLEPGAASVRVVDTSTQLPDEVPSASTPERAPEPVPARAEATPTERADADLDRIERDLAGVETALERLDAGTYWSDEVTGEPIPEDVLVVDPVARRAE